MNDELPVVIEQDRHGFMAYTPLYPNLSGQGHSQSDAVSALMTAIHKRQTRSRPSSPRVTDVDIRFRESR